MSEHGFGNAEEEEEESRIIALTPTPTPTPIPLYLRGALSVKGDVLQAFQILPVYPVDFHVKWTACTTTTNVNQLCTDCKVVRIYLADCGNAVCTHLTSRDALP